MRDVQLVKHKEYRAVSTQYDMRKVFTVHEGK